MLAVLMVVAAASPAVGDAAGSLTYEGKAKSLAGDFTYGPVRPFAAILGSGVRLNAI